MEEKEMVAMFLPRTLKAELKALTAQEDKHAMYMMVEKLINFYKTNNDN